MPLITDGMGVRAMVGQARAHIPVGAANRVGRERQRGVVPQDGLASRTGTGARGWRGPITEPSLPAWHSEHLSPWPLSVRFRLAPIPTCAGIGRIHTGIADIGTIAEQALQKASGRLRS